MQINQINQFVSNPQMVHSLPLNELNELNKRYPYCQLFTLMYLSALHSKNDIRFEEELHKNAYKIRDRKKLYHLMNLEVEVSQQDVLNDIIPLEKIVENKVLTPLENLNTEVDNKSKDNDKIEKEEITSVNLQIPQENKNNDLEKEYLANIISNSYQIEEHKEELKTNINIKEKRSFSDWLNLSKPAKEEMETTNFTFNKDVNQKIETKKELFSPIKKAKESLQENKMIYSETLANIYALQGNFPKAIEAFQQLMLSIPEKKLYFAKKIEELTLKINKK
ncbi:MAG: hypothetical protein HYU67_00845 [Flavobacteriia bacterium]|nr:hypothetical protein [Flavobacteriia bacterium]